MECDSRLAIVGLITLLGAACTGDIGDEGDGGAGDGAASIDATSALPDGGTADSGVPPANSDSPLGTNLNGISDWSTELAFVDAFKMSRAWISGNSSDWDDGRSFDVDEHGWVRSLQSDQIARTLLFWSMDGRYPAGQYHVFYEGGGTMEYWSGASRNAGLSSPGHDVIDVAPESGGIGINITAVDSPDYLRNIRVIMPGGACAEDATNFCDGDDDCTGSCELFSEHYATQRFHPTFLDRIEPYRVLRFMDWMATNHSPISSWSERAEVTDARWSSDAGVPVEVMVDLANRTRADAWFCMPHLADESFIGEFAELVASTLDGSATVYIEYSNEVWNGIFAQADYARAQGLDQGLSADGYQAQLFFYSQRAREVFAIWAAALPSSRLVRVMATQSVSSWVSEQVMGFGDGAASVDALAVAPYFGGHLGSPEEQSRVAAMSVDDLVAELTTVAVPDAIAALELQAAIAATNSVALIAYEGGQHLAGHSGVENNDTINALFDAVNRDPRMGTLYATYLDGWRASGGEIFVHFSNCGAWGKSGRWGSLEWIAQPRAESPKYDALQDFISANPRWW
jgi:hypothetical protein